MTEDDNDEFNITTESDGDDAPLADIAMEKELSRKKKRKRMMAVLGIIPVLAIILGGTIWIYMVNHDNDDSSSSTKTRTSWSSSNNGDSSSSSSDSSSSSSSTVDKSFMESVGVPDYYMSDSSKISESDKKTADSVALAMAPSNLSTALPSVVSNPNLTDDTSKAYNSDGTANPNYSYLTAENVSAQIADDVQRLINPVYGGWEDLQNSSTVSSSSAPVSMFSDMFDSDHADAVSSASLPEAKSLVPLFADWSANGYDGKYTDKSTSSLVGVADSMSCDYNIAGVSTDSISCTVNVTYHVKMKDGSDKTEAKTLTINYKPNYDNLPSSSRRILIDSIKQD